MSTLKDGASVAYEKLLNHGARCPDCRALRDKDGKSTGMCPEGDRLTLAHRQARKQTREAGAR